MSSQKQYAADSSSIAELLSTGKAEWEDFQRRSEMVTVQKIELDRLRRLAHAVRELRDMCGYNYDTNGFEHPLSRVMFTAEVLAAIFEEV